MASKNYPDGSKWLQDNGNELEIVEHLGDTKFKVKYHNSPIFTAGAKEIRTGKVKDKNVPVVCGVGYISYGEHIAKPTGSSSNTTEYEVWRGVILRCYDSKAKTYKGYGSKGVVVCNEWHNFQNFADWYTKQPMYGKGYHLDKDLLNNGANEYSPDNCTFVSPAINSLFTGGFKTVVYQRRSKWVVQLQMGEKCSNGNKRQSYFGEYTDKQEALEVYFKHKIAHVIKVANQEKDNLDERVYRNLTDPTWIREYINLLASEHEDNK